MRLRGGSVVTARARELMVHYRRFREQVAQGLAELYRRNLADFGPEEPR